MKDFCFASGSHVHCQIRRIGAVAGKRRRALHRHLAALDIYRELITTFGDIFLGARFSGG